MRSKGSTLKICEARVRTGAPSLFSSSLLLSSLELSDTQVHGPEIPSGERARRRSSTATLASSTDVASYGSGFRVQSLGLRVEGSKLRVQGSGFRVQGSGFRVQGAGFGVPRTRGTTPPAPPVSATATAPHARPARRSLNSELRRRTPNSVELRRSWRRRKGGGGR